MAAEYEPGVVEPRWQQYWEEHGTFQVEMDEELEKFYVLDMFPYPSGSGLHVGHVEGYTATDIVARFKRLRGFNVMHPMGWDAFGLPAEQYAIKTSTHPRVVTEQNVDNFRRQLKRLGFSYDWSREVNTTDPDYYRWTQWIFLKLYEMDLAYIAEVPVNWCPALGTVLANEEVTPEGTSEQGGHPVVRKPMRQWMLRITAYAERLLRDLDTIDWPEHLKEMQRNWIGRSLGAEVSFLLDPDTTGVASVNDDDGAAIRVFTTRPDTLFGATYMVLAPEHELVDTITSDAQREAVEQYRTEAARKSELQRTDLAKEKTGVFTGAYAINPVNHEKIPIWIADYVLASYGTGAIMSVPGHDQRDWEFARAFDLPIREVISGGDVEQEAHTGDGVLVNSDFLDGLSVEEAKKQIVAWLEERGTGRGAVNYKLRDWLFSRQRYWGEPFPVIHLEGGGHRPLPEERLPLRLPEVEKYEPSGTGESPLAGITEWVETTDPETGQPARRETNTMPQWAGSCWYYLRYLDPDNDQAPWARDKESYWMPVDLYVGGAEHAVLHLLYARFWHKVLYDCGLVSTIEPFQRVVNQGMILGKSYLYYELDDGTALSWEEGRDREEIREHPTKYERVVEPGQVRWVDERPMHPTEDLALHMEVEKMSKSRGNVVNPDDVIAEYGADALRLYEMFMGPLEQAKPWDDRSVSGVFRLITRIWRLLAAEDGEGLEEGAVSEEAVEDEDLQRALHGMLQQITEDTEALRFNTAIAAMFEYVNFLYKWSEFDGKRSRVRAIPTEAITPFVIALSPYAPHLAEELWHRFGQEGSVAKARWPDYDPSLLVEDTYELAVQVNGKLRGTIVIPIDADQDTAQKLAMEQESIASHVEGKTLRRVIFVPERILNFVVS